MLWATQANIVLPYQALHFGIENQLTNQAFKNRFLGLFFLPFVFSNNRILGDPFNIKWAPKRHPKSISATNTFKKRGRNISGRQCFLNPVS